MYTCRMANDVSGTLNLHLKCVLQTNDVSGCFPGFPQFVALINSLHLFIEVNSHRAEMKADT